MSDVIRCPTRLLHPDAQPPHRKDSQSMGYDIHCVAGLEGLISPGDWEPQQLDTWELFDKQTFIDLDPGETMLFRTGFAQKIQTGWGCLFRDRSGLGAKHNIHVLAGVIDESYIGEWFVSLVNLSKKPYRFYPGDRIVQGIYQPRNDALMPIVTELPHTQRGTGGLGSSGR